MSRWKKIVTVLDAPEESVGFAIMVGAVIVAVIVAWAFANEILRWF